MSADYRNLLISKNPIDWDLVYSDDECRIYGIYEMVINNIHFYFANTCRYSLFQDFYLKYYNKDTLIVEHADIGSIVYLYHYDGKDVIDFGTISEDFVYRGYLSNEEIKAVNDSFKELLNTALNKIGVNADIITDEIFEILIYGFVYISYCYDKEIPDKFKPYVTKIH
jgi:hypothetical protein